MSQWTNAKVAEILRSVAAAYQIKGLGNIFQIRAYENAAAGVEHATQEATDLWQEGKLAEIPGVGKSIQAYLDELFTVGRVKHFEEVLQGIPKAATTFLNIPGVGPKTAFKLATVGQATSLADLKSKLSSGELKKLGWSDLAITNLSRGIVQLESLSTRLLLPEAIATSSELIKSLQQVSSVLEAHPAGSVRRMVATVGDLDIVASAHSPRQVLTAFTKLPPVGEVISTGSDKASVTLKNGLQVDLLVTTPDYFGSALQHFTGSRAHNIHLRKLAQSKGWSLSEYGLTKTKSGVMVKFESEEDLYELLGLSFIPPEIREDTGEIEAALAHQLPDLVQLADMRGDLHSHTSYSDGQDSVVAMADQAQLLGYDYLALTDHSYPNLKYSQRLKDIEEYNYSNNTLRVIKGLEVNITTSAKLQVPDSILAQHEFNTASIHSGFNQDTLVLTERVVTALRHPLINMLSHPTGRLLGDRPGYDLDWEKVFSAAQEFDKILEIDGFPNRSDLPDQLIREAVRRNIKLAVDTDAHQAEHLQLMNFGVALARRGWARPELIVNTWPKDKLLTYLAKPRIKL